MSFRRRLKYYLVHQHGMSNQRAQELIESGKISVGGQKIHTNIILPPRAGILLDGKEIKPEFSRRIILMNKPPGFVSSLNENVECNLRRFIWEADGLSIAGRLDKASEGLLLLSDDGEWIETIINPRYSKEKEYLVELDREPDTSFFGKFAGGLDLGSFITQPCHCETMGGRLISVILKEGKNRQIRKMCARLGYQVVSLKRIRIAEFSVSGLNPGEWKEISKE